MMLSQKPTAAAPTVLLTAVARKAVTKAMLILMQAYRSLQVLSERTSKLGALYQHDTRMTTQSSGVASYHTNLSQ